MKQLITALISAFAIVGMTAPSWAAPTAPTNVDPMNLLRNDLRLGMNLVEVAGSGSVVIERGLGTLNVYATSSEERRAVPDGTYKFRRAGIEECGVQDGAVVWCR